MPHDLICLSHLRWDFVHQRPQHLMGRAARDRRVLFVEEPMRTAGVEARMHLRSTRSGVIVAVPMLPDTLSPAERVSTQARLLEEVVREMALRDYLLWYYTPLATAITGGLTPSAVVYDCMDELSGFLGASAELPRRERALLAQADVVFTGGASLYHAKRHLHHNIHCFPSALDFAHFAQGRVPQPDPADQAPIPRPRAGFVGVIDERMDLDLVGKVADFCPDIEFVMIGPVVKIDPASLPLRGNIHWLGGRSYDQLPSYLAGWDVALLPFAHNAATRFISPTKIPEYLAAGPAVVSTSIRDVVQPYGAQGLVRIADQPEAFARAVEEALHEPRGSRWPAVDRVLARMSWDQTWHAMDQLLSAVSERRVAVVRSVELPARLRPTIAATGSAETVTH